LVASALALLWTSGCGDDDTTCVDACTPEDGGFTRDTGPPGCGNEEIEGDEVCDDGNTNDGDGCSANCMSVERCGNNYIDTPIGEICDDGNSLSGDGCSPDCTSDETCGNSIVDLGVGEVCDDGNTVDMDGCSADCTMGPMCGDGMTHPGEACDDGNTEGGDGCSADCTSDETCGNMVTDPGEECDDGNTDGDDGCSATCTLERCGNGAAEGTEACDDGNMVDGDGCDNDCTFSCEAAADCDDTNLCNGDETCGASHTCEAGTPPAAGTDCGGGMVCRAGACVAPACGNGTREGTEVCDDGNSTEGDGCDNDCTYSCTGTGDCDDANACNGAETCNTTSHVCTNPPDLADGTSCGGSMVCRAGACTTAACGNGIPEGTEQCDDGDMTNGDGCDNDCTWSCTAAADCTDGNACNGSETCTLATHVCAAGTPPAAGTACDRDMNPGTRDICRMSMCVASTCGDTYVDSGGGEQCDDGNTTNGDGCDNDCTYSCEVAADCADTNTCNGSETCNTSTHRCAAGTPAANGTLCDADMMAGTRDICLMSSCVLTRCGDGYLDTGASPPEVCDDGNLVAGDGCEPTCQPTGPRPTAFRVISLDLMDPHFYVSLFGCRDVTDSPLLGFSVNGSLQESVDDYTLNYITVHRPLDLAMSTNPMELVDGECMSATPPICQVGTMGAVFPTTANNSPSGMTCYTPDPATLNSAYMSPNTVTGPCFVSNETMITVALEGTPIPLRYGRIAATYAGGVPPNQLISGVISGFLTEADARAAILPGSLPLVGGDSLWEHLAAAGASGSSCSSRDDRDTYMGTTGFWVYMNFASRLADWRGP
jgi:cysteine-rich repeat protein